MPFSNPIVGGTALVRPAINSPNFQTGAQGWSINRDGSAEFNNIVIRNGTVVSGSALYYSGPPALGNLVASISATGGTDPHGNTYPAGFGLSSAGQIVAVGTSGAKILIDPNAPTPTIDFVDSTLLNTSQIRQEIPSLGVVKLHVTNVTNLQVDTVD